MIHLGLIGIAVNGISLPSNKIMIISNLTKASNLSTNADAARHKQAKCNQLGEKG